jgi:hypothetical protein
MPQAETFTGHLLPDAEGKGMLHVDNREKGLGLILKIDGMQSRHYRRNLSDHFGTRVKVTGRMGWGRNAPLLRVADMSAIQPLSHKPEAL